MYFFVNFKIPQHSRLVFSMLKKHFVLFKFALLLLLLFLKTVCLNVFVSFCFIIYIFFCGGYLDMLYKHNELKEERKKFKFNFDTLYSKEFWWNAAYERQYLTRHKKHINVNTPFTFQLYLKFFSFLFFLFLGKEYLHKSSLRHWNIRTVFKSFLWQKVFWISFLSYFYIFFDIIWLMFSFWSFLY